MCARADLHSLRGDFDALLRQTIRFDEERFGIDDHAVAEHTRFATMHDSGGQQVQHKGLVADLDGVTGVVTALVAGNDIEPLPEQIDDLALTFIAPLGADDSDYVRHYYSFPISNCQFQIGNGNQQYNIS